MIVNLCVVFITRVKWNESESVGVLLLSILEANASITEEANAFSIYVLIIGGECFLRRDHKETL